MAANLISQMVIPPPVGETDPARRLRQISAETAARKALHRAPLGGVFRNKLVAGLMLKLVARQRVNIVSADLPGPLNPLHFAGAQVLEVFPLVNLIGTVSLGVAALSYAGTFTIMIDADADAYPDLDVFAAGVRDELAALAATQGRSAPRCGRQSPRPPRHSGWTRPLQRLGHVARGRRSV
jgi:diacylglycerol O-acyltransferase / wax synthase